MEENKEYMYKKKRKEEMDNSYTNKSKLHIKYIQRERKREGEIFPYTIHKPAKSSVSYTHSSRITVSLVVFSCNNPKHHMTQENTTNIFLLSIFSFVFT